MWRVDVYAVDLVFGGVTLCEQSRFRWRWQARLYRVAIEMSPVVGPSALCAEVVHEPKA